MDNHCNKKQLLNKYPQANLKKGCIVIFYIKYWAVSVLVYFSISVNCDINLGLLPCFNGDCYSINNTCDENLACSVDWADEQGCKLFRFRTL